MCACVGWWCVCVCVCMGWCVVVCVGQHACLSVCRVVCMCVCVCVSRRLFACACACVCVCVTQCDTVYMRVCPFVYVCVAVCLCVCGSACGSMSMCLCVSLTHLLSSCPLHNTSEGDRPDSSSCGCGRWCTGWWPGTCSCCGLAQERAVKQCPDSGAHRPGGGFPRPVR